jgi:methionyl-tRNA formyltransferase
VREGPPRTLHAAARTLARWRALRPFVGLARRLRVPVVHLGREGTAPLDASLVTLGPDLLCVAAFPYRLAASTLGVPRRGALNVHPSLLPRHRGPAPLFWTYFHDDSETGVTVHWMDEGLDTGDIVAQETVPIARGRAGVDLYEELSARGAALLVGTLGAVAAGTAPRLRQDEARATREPLPRRDTWRIDFATWSAERLWHFLAGIGGTSRLRRPDGTPVPHGRVLGYTREPHGRPPGTLEHHPAGWRVYCRDGVVDVAGPEFGVRLRHHLRAPSGRTPRTP